MQRLKSYKLLAWLVLAIGLAATYFAQRLAYNAAHQLQQENFTAQAREVALRIEHRLVAYEEILRGSRGLFTASSRVERNEFHQYVESLRLEAHYPGIQGLGFSLVVPPDEKSGHIASVRKQGFPAYTIRPAGQRALYTSIIYLEPFTPRNQLAFGYDMYSEAVRRAAMERARDLDQAAMSGKVTLVQENEQLVQAGFLLYVPVYRNDRPHATLAERRANIVGWVYAPFRMNNLMEGILGEHIDDIDYEIYDYAKNAPEMLMYDADGHRSMAGYQDNSLFHHLQDMEIAGRSWSILLRSLPAYEAAMDTSRVVAIQLSGILMSVLLSLLVWQLSNRREQAFDLANKMTRELRASEKALNEAQEIAGLGSYSLYVQDKTWTSSGTLDRLFGIDRTYDRTVAGWEALVHPDDRAMMDDYLWNEVIGQHKVFDKDYRIVRYNDKAERWVHGLGKLEFDEQGNVDSMIGTIQDITARKLAEASLIKLSLAVEQSPNSIVITNLDAQIEYVNRAFTAVTGYSAEEALGQNPRILQSGKTSRETYDDIWAHLSRGETWRGELINRRKDGSEYIESAVLSPVRQDDGKITHYLAVKSDITEKKQAEERIERLAHFDQLTGLPNRSMLDEHFKLALGLAQRNGEPIAVMFLDLDHFKNINDTLGHSVGDQLLMVVAERLKGLLRTEDIVSRQGGDEFILVLSNTDVDGAVRVASKLMAGVAEPFQLELYELSITTSIGIALYPEDGQDLESLSKNADVAMYRAKKEGRNNFRFFTSEMQVHSARILLLSNALRHALGRNEFYLHYQPQISVQDGQVIGVEALLRWQHPELGLVSPAEFITIAEDGGMIIPIGEWVIRTASRQLKAWMDSGLPPMTMAVNLSAVQFRQENITGTISDILAEVGLANEYLEIELTEAVAMDNPQAAIDVMNKLHAQGIRMSIDDFGTGYSSLNYLKRFKVYKLKIDQSFVRDLTDDPDDKAIIQAIINLADSMGMRTIAEGVETAGQLNFLRLHGCAEVQGYYFSKPLSADEVEKYVNSTINKAAD